MAKRAISTIYGRLLVRSVAMMVLLVGIALGIGGVYLVSLDGSRYFMTAGATLTLAAILMLRLNPFGAVLFALTYVATLVWSLWDAGLHFWPLVSRLFILSLLAILVASVYPALCRAAGILDHHPIANTASFVISLSLILTMISAVSPKGVISNPVDLRVLPIGAGEMQHDWAHFGNNPAGQRFAVLDQITKNNVQRLKVIWQFDTLSSTDKYRNRLAPLQVGDTLFICTSRDHVLALNADTGMEKWRYTFAPKDGQSTHCEGLVYANLRKLINTKTTETCAERIYAQRLDGDVIALDTETGAVCTGFGNKGTLTRTAAATDTLHNLAPLTVVDELLVVANSLTPNPTVLSAYALTNGKPIWSWAPQDEKIPARLAVSGALAYDAKLNSLFAPIAFSGNYLSNEARSNAEDTYSSSVVALDKKTGKLRWHFQTVKHDRWNYHVAAQPLLLNLPMDEEKQSEKSLIALTKQGDIFLINRETGTAISEVTDETLSSSQADNDLSTQPRSLSMPTLAPADITESSMWGLGLVDHMLCRIAFKQLRYEGIFTPPGADAALHVPGHYGSINEDGASLDPNNHVLYVNVKHSGSIDQLTGLEDQPTSTLDHQKLFISPLGVPCLQPPFSSLSAIHLPTQKIVWQTPVGGQYEFYFWGQRIRFKIPLGLESRGPTLATQSGLLFFAGSGDKFLRAFDAIDGSELWRSQLPAKSHAGIMSYISSTTGVQYLLVHVNNVDKNGEHFDTFIAYALKDR